MPIAVQNFPILTPGQMNPFNQALSSGLDTYQNMMKAAYYPQTTMADINSKNAYANNIRNQTIASLLNNPLATYGMSQDDFKKYIQQVLTGQNNGGGGSAPDNNASTSDTAVPAPAQEGGIGGFMDKMINAGKSLFQMGEPAPIQAPQPSGSAAPSVAQMQAQPTPNVGSNEDFGAVNKESPEQVNADMDQRAGSLQNVPRGTSWQDMQNAQIAAKLPGSPQGMAVQQQKVNMDVQADLWKDRLKDEGQNIDTTAKAITSLKAMKELYPQLSDYEKGTGKGLLPAISNNAQLFDQFAENQSASNIRALQSGHITDADFRIGQRLKPSRNMNEAAFQGAEEFNEALQLRNRQKQLFDSEAFKKGMTLNDADSLWNRYIDSHPMYDAKAQRMIKQNVTESPFSSKVSKESNDSNLYSKNTKGFDPVSMLDRKYKTKEEFVEALKTLSPEARGKVISAMKERGMH